MDPNPLFLEYQRHGSEQAFSQLVRQHLDLVYSAAQEQVIDPGLAEDVTQAVFLVLHRKATRLRSDTILTAWLLTTTHLCARDAIKRRARREKHESRAARMHATNRSAPGWDDLSESIDQAMASLPRADREVLVLRFWESRSQKQIADAIGITENAATKRTTRAMEKLRHAMARQGIAMPAEAMGGMLAGNLIKTAPAHLGTTITSALGAASAQTINIANGAIYAMTITRTKIAIGAIVLLVVVSVPVTVLVLQDRRPPVVALMGDTIAEVSANQPATSGPIDPSNAALAYRDAIQKLTALLEPRDVSAQFDRYTQGTLDAQTGDFLKRGQDISRLVREAASIEKCDWGILDASARLKDLSGIRNLHRYMIIESKYAVQQHDNARALDASLAAMTMSHQFTSNGVMTAKLVEVASDIQNIDWLASILPTLDALQLRSLQKRLDEIPQPETGAEMMAAEFANAQAMQAGNAAQLGVVVSMAPFYKVVGDAFDAQPLDEFPKTVNAEVSKYSSISTAAMLLKILAPSLIRPRETMAISQAKHAMLRTAIDVQINGEAAIANSRDPFGQGPFTYTKTANGFELFSSFKVKQGPVNLTIGTR